MAPTAAQRIKSLFNLYRLVGWMPVSKDRRLAWQRKVLDREYKRALAAAGSDQEELDSVRGTYVWDFRLLDEEIDTHHSKWLARKAARLHVPTPPFDDKTCWAQPAALLNDRPHLTALFEHERDLAAWLPWTYRDTLAAPWPRSTTRSRPRVAPRSRQACGRPLPRSRPRPLA
jgi:hypothetical protein